MAIVTVEQMQAQLNLLETMDGDILAEKINAAQDHIERMLGFKIEEQFGGEDQEDIPASLAEAVKQLAATWYENRETVIIGHGATVVPFSVNEIVTAYREWSF